MIQTKFRSHRADFKRKLGETNHYFYEAKASSQHPSRCQRGSTINSRSTALKVLRTSPFAPHKKWSQGSDPLPPPFPHQECLLKVGSIFHKVLEILQCLNSHLVLQDQGGTSTETTTTIPPGFPIQTAQLKVLTKPSCG